MNRIINGDIVMHNFGLEVYYSNNGTFDSMHIAENIELDVDFEDTSDGLVVSQIQNSERVIIKQPVSLFDSSRKINRDTKNFPIGLSKVEIAGKKTMAKLTRPPEGIPIGCWCYNCDQSGPNGHDTKCTFPNIFFLRATLRGLVDGLFSKDRQVQQKILDIADSQKRFIVFKILNGFLTASKGIFKTDHSDIERTFKYEDMDRFQEIFDTKQLAYIAENTDDSVFLRIIKDLDEPEFFTSTDNFSSMRGLRTSFSVSDVKVINGLNKSNKIEYYPGAVILQYSLYEKKTTIRIYRNFVHFITVPTSIDVSRVMTNVFTRYSRTAGSTNGSTNGAYVPNNVIIDIAKSSFNLIPESVVDYEIDLAKLHSCFHPVDTFKNPIQRNEYMYSKEFFGPDGAPETLYFTEFNGKLYEYTVSPPENKRMTMSIIEYNALNNPGYYKLTCQIHSSGIVQLVFVYNKGSKELVKEENISRYNLSDMRKLREIIMSGSAIENILEYKIGLMLRSIDFQMENNVRRLFNNVKNLFYSKLTEINEKVPDFLVQTDKRGKSENIINSVPGLMPYRKKIFPHAGNIVEFFNDSDPNNVNGWVTEDSERGFIIDVTKAKGDSGSGSSSSSELDTDYWIAKGTPVLTQILKIDKRDESYVPNKHPLSPRVLSAAGPGFLLEPYSAGQDTWVLLDTELVKYKHKHFRIYKYSLMGKLDKGDVQVCSKTINDGVEMRPDPFSFYGQCPGGLNEVVSRVGVRSRKDNLFYPVCEQVKDRDAADKDMISFILDGLTSEQMREADIDPNVTFELHGKPIADKFAGTFKPGTVNKGSRVHFWSDEKDQWLEGTITGYNKDHGLGNDLNYVWFLIDVTEPETARYQVRGDSFHPMHRESRNFEGLRKLFKTEEQQKRFLVSCAKKLNILRPSVPLVNLTQAETSKVLAKLGKLFRTQTWSFSDETRPIKPFVKKNIFALEKSTHFAAVIPNYSIRCVLFIVSKDTAYILGPEGSVSDVDVFFKEPVTDTVIEGFMTDDKVFYPVDILMHNGTRVKEDYMRPDNMGRVDILNGITNSSSRRTLVIMNPVGTKNFYLDNDSASRAFVGPSQGSNLLKFVSKNIGLDNLLFIDNKAGSNLYLWLNHVPHIKITAQLVVPLKGQGFYLGLNGKILIEVPIYLDRSFKLGDFVKFKINMTASGQISDSSPFLDIVRASAAEAKTIEETYNDINLVMFSVSKTIFSNQTRWDFSSVKSSFVAGETFLDPLIKLE